MLAAHMQACSSDEPADVGSTAQTSTGAGSGSGGSAGSGSGSSSAADVARRLGRTAHFLIGMGNDLDNDHDRDGAYTLGVTVDIHDAYLVGVNSFSWTKYNTNPDGSFVNLLADAAQRHGVTPMYTLYSMASRGEANASVLTNDAFMRPYWDEAKLLYQRLADFDGPAIVHLEPDWWAFAQLAEGDPTKLPAHVGSLAPDCAGAPENLVGMGNCLITLGRKYAPKVILGFHASRWANSDPGKIASYLVQLGAGDSDVIVTDTLDRDAGCFEAHVDPNCQRNDGPWYWDETNTTSPNFHEHLAWAKAIVDGVGKPMLWWQTPFGVPSDTPGGTASHYRDNRVRYIFAHPEEFVAAGGVGVEFGVGAGNQTYIDTDGGQFKTAITRYFASPTPLP